MNELIVTPSGSSPYPVIASPDFSDILIEKLKKLDASKLFILTEKNLKENVLSVFLNYLSEKGMSLENHVLLLEPGEENKHLKNTLSVFNELIERNADRKSVLIALGGGVVGDFTGFIAANFLRGIRFVQIPTTLLSAVDSSVGGKVAVNVDKGKNMIGAFYHPQFVFFRLNFLNTLPVPEWNCGLAEMAKHAILDESGDLFRSMQENKEHLRIPGPVLAREVVRSAAFKASVVAQDEKETGLRAILNLGHTTGHAIESFTNYSVFSHGETVSRGLATMLFLSHIVNGLPENEMNHLLNFLKDLDLPMDRAGFRAEDLFAHMKFDKKAKLGVPEFVLLDKNKKIQYGCRVSFEQFQKAWELQKRFDQ